MQQQMEEGGLIGDQDKLDVDGDGNLTRKDFASLRQAELGNMGDPPEGRFTTPPSKTNGQVMDRTTNFLPGNTSFINEDTESLTYAYTGKDDGVQKGIIIPDSMTGKNINRKKLYKEALKNEAAGLETEGNVRFERDGAGNVIYSPGTEEEVDTRTVEQQLTDAGGFQMQLENMKAGGAMFKKLMKKAWGGNLTAPGASSEDYVSDRAAMFVNAIKQNTAMSTLNESMKGDPFAKAGLPSKSLGGLPTFEGPDGSSDVNSETARDNDLGFTDKQMEYIKNLTSGLNKVQQGIQNPNLQYQGFSGYNPYMNNMTVGYRDPRQFTAYDEIQRGMNPFARLIANSGRTYGAPRITGYNLPGGISGADFLAQMQGMSGVGPDGTPYRVTDVERYKKGNFLTTLNPFKKRERGLRYNIDYGTGLTDGSASDEQTTSTSGSGAMSREDMLNDLSKNERKQFRRLQRGRDAVSANEAYDILKGDRNIPAQNEETTLEQMRANAAAAGDGLGADAIERKPTLEEMRAKMRGAEGDMIANPAAEVDPALADAGSQEAQGFQPMTEDDLTAKQRRQIKRGKTSLDEINELAERDFDVQSQIDGAEQARIDEEQARIDNVRAVMNDPNANVASPRFAQYQQNMKGTYEKRNYKDGAYEGMNEPGRKEIPVVRGGSSYTNPGASLGQSAFENAYKDKLADTADGEMSWKEKYLNSENRRKNIYDDAYSVDNPNAPTLQNPTGDQPMSIKSLPVVGREKPAVPELQITDPNQQFGKRTTRQLQRKGILDADGNVVPVEGKTPMPPTVEEMQANADRAQREQDQIAAMEQGVIDQGNRQGARELFERQNPIASSDQETSKQRILELQEKGREAMDPFTLSEERMPAGSVPVQPGLTYGGGVSPQALANAVDLINMAFGGQPYNIPQATFGNMGMRMSNDSANVFSPEQIEALQKMQAGNSGTGTVDVAQDQGFSIDTNALGQSYMLGAKAINFLDATGEMNRAQDQNALRDQNAINTPESYALSQVGLDNQFGQRFNTNFNNQVLNPTSNVGFGYGGGEYPFPQTMEYGGQYYEIGGDIDLTPEKLAEFEAAGFVLTRK